MKHLLIILISILLLSSPVNGDNHKGETLYRLETSSGEVWKGFGDKDTQPKYQGDVKSGVPNGQGTLTYPNGGKFVGEWKNGKPNGNGTFTFPDGGNYVGEYKDGEYHGQGTYTWSDGDKYEGEYKDGEMWNGTLYDKDGNIKYKYVNGVKQK